MRTRSRALVSIAAVAVSAAGLTACGGSSTDESSVKPVADVPSLSGTVTYYKPGTRHPYVTGDIRHAGSGLALTSGATKVELTNFDIDPAHSRLYGNVSVNGKSTAKHAMIFKLNGSTLKPLQTGPSNTAVLEGTTVHVSTVADGLLNKTFKTDAVKPGLLVGVATITINTK